jgi:hypothetical protein
MNIIANTIQCVNGLCSHAEHKANILWWLIPTVIVGIYLIHLGRTHTDTE